MNDRLYRSLDDRHIAGVAGGMAQAWNVDPSILRIAWVILALLTGGLAILVYIVMAIVVPEEHQAGQWAAADAATRRTRDRRGANGPLFVGVLLLLIGFVLFTNTYLPGVRLDRLWPFVVIGLGVMLLVTSLSSRSRLGNRPS